MSLEVDIQAAWTRERVRSGLFGQAEPVLLGRYRLGEILRTGAMGVVFAAEDALLGRSVAVKLVRPGPTDARRLLREGRALAQLVHPNVVRVLDAGDDGGRAFLVLERVQGQTLDEWIATRAPDPRAVLDVVLAAGAGLAAAHAQGLVHRDVKPRNILVDEVGVARLSDFGLVRPDEEVTDDQRAAAAAGAIDHTTASALLGTPAYMSPEQLRGESGDARSDQFSFGATLHEALYGARPYTARTATELLEIIQRGEALRPPSHMLWAFEVIQRSLSARPEDRYASVGALLDDLGRRRSSVGAMERLLVDLGSIERERFAVGANLDALLRRAQSSREAFERARSEWPDNPDAAGVARALEETVAHLDADIAAARAHENDPDAGNRIKARWTAFFSLLWAFSFLAFGWSLRHGMTSAEASLGLAAFYGGSLLLHLGIRVRERRVFEATAASRKMINVSGLSFAAHALVGAMGWAIGMPVGFTLASALVMGTVVWLAAAITFDRRLAAVAPFSLTASLGAAAWPSWAFEWAALAAGGGLGAMAFAFRVSDDKPIHRVPRQDDAA